MNEFEIYLWAAGAILVVVSAVVIWHRATRRARYGAKCEKKVAKVLSRLRGGDFEVVNDILFSTGREGRTVQIDHIVVSTRGIFIIETKGHRGHIVGNENAQYWEQKFMMSAKSFYNPLLQNDGHLRALRRRLPGIAAELFFTAVVFTDAWRIDIAADDIVEHRKMLPDRHVRRTLDPTRRRPRRWWSRRGEVVLDERRMVMQLESLTGEIRRRQKVIDRSRIGELASRIRSLDLKGRQARSQHKTYARSAARHGIGSIKNGRCPRCGGTLGVREGDYGPCYACSNYPECRFICSIHAAGL